MKMLMGKSCETRTAEVGAMSIMISCIRTAMALVGIGFLIMKLAGKTDAFSIVLYVLAGLAVIIGIAEYAMLRGSLEDATSVVRELMADPLAPPQTRLNAARTTLEFTLKATEQLDILTRLEALEAAQNGL